MSKKNVFLLLFIASSAFAETSRGPASLSSDPSQIKAQISKLRADVVGKDGKPNRKVIDDITKLENRLSELKFKEGRSNR